MSGGIIPTFAYANQISGHSQEHRSRKYILFFIDISDRKELEQRMNQTQKMQAIGQLAGGIAHDFNNLLTAMLGFCDLLLQKHPAGDPSFVEIMQIKQNSTRAANLVQQLLAFSRRQTLRPTVMDITDVLGELTNLLRRLIGENIELKMHHERNIWLAKVDQSQLEQVIINLAVNARDAMNDGGKLEITTQNVTIGKEFLITPDMVMPTADDKAIAGEFVLVQIKDTGHGIPSDIITKIFEPFFSTKEVGSGTGLGLATVYGIIKQTDGHIIVQSSPGNGTIFSLLFKRHIAEAGDEQGDKQETSGATNLGTSTLNNDLTGEGIILLVEDEAAVRAFAARALSNKGYTVLEAGTGEAALSIVEKRGKDIQIIISDVVMPGLNGPAMVERAKRIFPHLKIIFISGYAEEGLVGSFQIRKKYHFLPKPFTLKQLASKVKEVSLEKEDTSEA
ncbi:MAG: response regulator [Alphaproteobacteria bacterium]|nr:response regulator [Alphaproteobacteria bacterium]